MAEEEKKVVEQEEQKPEATEEPKSEEEGTEETKVEPLKQNTEFEDALKRERELGRQEGAAEIAFKVRDKKRKGEDDDEEEDEDEPEDKPLTQKQLDSILAQERQKTMKVLQASQIVEIAKRLAKGDAEADLIVEIHKNRIFPEGLSLQDQLEESHAIANRKRLPAQNEELKRALRHEDTKSDANIGTHRDASKAGEPNASRDITAIKASGYNWDGARQVYKKPLKGNKTLFYDPKKKKTWVE